MKNGCISVKKGAFLKDFKTMSNFENCKNMEIMRVVEKQNAKNRSMFIDVYHTLRKRNN